MSRDLFLDLSRRVWRRAYGQRLQDVWAWYVSGCRPHGYFVEFGALNGRDFSNTYLLEVLGWTGCVAEPHPDYAERLETNRSCYTSTRCVSNVTGETVGFKAVRGRPALSTMADIDPNDYMEEAGRRLDFVLHQVETISLTDLLDDAQAPAEIDYLSIDTEGSELMILESLDVSKYRFHAVSVEHNFSPLREPLHSLLTSRGLIRIWPELSGHDDWYVSPERLASLPTSIERAAHLVDDLPEASYTADRLGVLAGMFHDVGNSAVALSLAGELAEIAPDSPVVATIQAAADRPESP